MTNSLWIHRLGLCRRARWFLIDLNPIMLSVVQNNESHAAQRKHIHIYLWTTLIFTSRFHHTVFLQFTFTTNRCIVSSILKTKPNKQSSKSYDNDPLECVFYTSLYREQTTIDMVHSKLQSNHFTDSLQYLTNLLKWFTRHYSHNDNNKSGKLYILQRVSIYM